MKPVRRPPIQATKRFVGSWGPARPVQLQTSGTTKQWNPWFVHIHIADKLLS